jgi:hypothetical protein
MAVINLDRSITDPRDPGGALRNRWRRATSVVALLALGGVVGGYGVFHWQSQRLRRAHDSTVAVLLFPGRISARGGTVASSWAGEPETVVDLVGSVAIVNAGPTPINVINAFVDDREFTLRSQDAAGWINPGTATDTGVSVKVGCSNNHLEAIRVSLSVETSTRQSLELPSAVTLDGSLWDDEVERVCAAS